jgi:hypothetical protein
VTSATNGALELNALQHTPGEITTTSTTRPDTQDPPDVENPYESVKGKFLASLVYMYMFFLAIFAGFFATGVLDSILGILIVFFLVYITYFFSIADEAIMLRQAFKRPRQKKPDENGTA